MSARAAGWILAAALGAAAALLGGCGASSPRFGGGSGFPSGITGGTPSERESMRVGPGPDHPHELQGVASYYAEEFDGRTTSNGEVYDMEALTAAHKTLPFDTRVRVTNLETGRNVEVRINDRGPFKQGRVIDLSLAAARELAMIGPGTARVSIQVLDWGPWTPPSQ